MLLVEERTVESLQPVNGGGIALLDALALDTLALDTPALDAPAFDSLQAGSSPTPEQQFTTSVLDYSAGSKHAFPAAPESDSRIVESLPAHRLTEYFRALEEAPLDALDFALVPPETSASLKTEANLETAVLPAAPIGSSTPIRATMNEMERVARLLSSCFEDIPVAVIPAHESKPEQGYRLQLTLFFDDLWMQPTIVNTLQSLPWFTLLISPGEMPFTDRPASFTFNLDKLGPSSNGDTEWLMDIGQRVFDGVFKYEKYALNGPWV